MKIFTLDTEGWAETHNELGSIESSIECIDIQNNEYIVIDENGFLYSWNKNQANYCGYEFQITDRRDLSLLEKLQRNESNDPFRI
ncbi:MAG: hypothetical protein V7765_07195 [Oleispira sp.]